MRVIGTVVEQESGKPLAGLRVRAYDKDLVFDDDLGEAVTDESGQFEVDYMEAQYRDLNETQPDVYVRVYSADGSKLLYSSEKAVRRSAQVTERFDIRIPRAELTR
jgi:5-hydroxyisourate hydrolase-like protein (transthyretin family)